MQWKTPTRGGITASVNPNDVLSARDLLEDSMDNAFDDELAREQDKNNDRIDQLMVAMKRKLARRSSQFDAIATLEASPPSAYSGSARKDCEG